MAPILERIAAAVQHLMPPGRVLAAVSGGADSLALLRVLLASGRDVTVAHVNHQMRGGESDADEAHVRELCERLGVPFQLRRVQVLGASNIEAQARRLRYDALEEVALAHGCGLIATGHTANDVLETILLHWLRGATVSGMRGIEAVRALHAGSPIQLARPLLDVTRAECEAICGEVGWNWREDSSNDDPKYLRNRVRRELVPLLANLMDATGASPGSCERAARQSARAAGLWADDLDLLDDLARGHLDAICTRRSQGLLVLNGDGFCLLPASMQRRVLRLGARQVEAQAERRGDGEDGAAVEPVIEPAGDVSSMKIEEARLWICERRRRCVWQWSRNLRVEWCGAGSGNRIRLARVELGANR